MKRTTILLFAISFGLMPLHAQVPQLMNYQGRVVTGGTNFSGTGQFKFALVNSAGTTSFWSNDATSAGGGQPTAAVSLTVSNGLYAVLLGNTALPNMIAVPYTVFTNQDVRLRVWFDDGVTGFQLLTPDQRIASVGYAMIAANVPDGVITSNKLANGAVTGAKIADGSITASKLSSNTVTSLQLSNSIALGSSALAGQLAVYRTAAGGPAITLAGATSQISTYGSDGLEQIRLWGSSYGELLLNNSLANNYNAVTLTANGSSGGALLLNNTNGATRAYLNGGNTGGALALYQADGQTGAYLWGDSGGSGLLNLYGTNGLVRAQLYGQGSSGGGEARLYNSTGAAGVTLFGGQDGGGAIYVGTTNGADRVVMDGNSANGGGEIRVQTGIGGNGVRLYGDSGGAGAVFLYNTNSSSRLSLDGFGYYGGGQIFGFANDGSTTLNFQADNGAGAGLIEVRNNVSSTRVALVGENAYGGGQVQTKNSAGYNVGILEGDSYGGGFYLYDSDGDPTVTWRSSSSGGGFGYIYKANSTSPGLYLDGETGNAGYLAVYGTNGTQNIILNGKDGNGKGKITTEVIQITGGADLSENFNVHAEGALQPGMVVSIDPTHPGELRLSTCAHDRTVAGIISGAGGIQTGMLMGQQDTKADGKHPIALSGRVYCLADASNGAIQPGDLLTTAATPGHAMRVSNHTKAQGAILGKAMTSLEQGQGLVLVLVSLQ